MPGVIELIFIELIFIELIFIELLPVLSGIFFDLILILDELLSFDAVNDHSIITDITDITVLLILLILLNETFHF